MIPDYYWGQLNLILQCKSPQARKLAIAAAYQDKKFIKALKMICKNTINQGLDLTEKQKNQLKKHAAAISFIAESRTNGKRKVIQNGGGFLSILIPLVASLVGSAINGANA